MENIKTDNIIKTVKYNNPKFVRRGAVLGGLATAATIGADKFIKTSTLKPAGDKKTAAITGAIIAGGTILGAAIGKIFKNQAQNKLAKEVLGELVQNMASETGIEFKSVEDFEKYVNEQ